ncbi:MAG: hypothetical protein NVSMB45_03030 [Ginsengibacter sp.]
METTATSNFEENKLPQSLNVLTILTFIGCAINYIFGVLGYVNAEKSIIDIQTGMNNPNMPSFFKNMMTPEALENARVMAANKLPLLILGLVATSLCLYGAIEMRKGKMNGYYLWLTGEILPFISALIFINAASLYKGMAVIGLIITAIFILLYTMQRKYLTNN